jgi:Protein of unknown function (DUF4446)
VSELDSTTGIVALAAAGIAVVALLAVVFLAIRLRRVRAEQIAVLGGEARDVVAHAAGVERQVQAQARELAESTAALQQRLEEAERRLAGTVSHTAVIRYDAYDEMTGRQSSSIALLDDAATGIVFSAILHRDQARFFAKWVVDGESELDLSPEEREAIDEAMAGRKGRESALEPARHPQGGR